MELKKIPINCKRTISPINEWAYDWTVNLKRKVKMASEKNEDLTNVLWQA
jgi:hypothetical protein